jgi:NAD-dependent epimerase/dehydratase family protein
MRPNSGRNREPRAALRALIGHTGFVGSNLLRAGEYDALFNSRNFRDIAGTRFDEVVCAGVSAAKWLANREPEADRAAVTSLTAVLEKAAIGRFVLISTIDVYPDPSLAVDETFDPNRLANHAYGTHRLALEEWVRSRYRDHLIARLPALFGPGLRKNALYDLLHDNEVGKINPAGVFQWYPVERLAADLDIARAAGLRLVNLFAAPVPMSTIIERHFPDRRVGPVKQPAPRYDLRTRHPPLFGGRDGYVMTQEEELAAIAEFIAAQRGRGT